MFITQIKGSGLILYDKNSVFLGMSNQELYFLGYEDMEEFRNYCNDFADLFVNKPGYIFKFQNFSWIDYTLHSGTPNKKVLVRTKHGKEVETSVTINEIFLTKEVNQTSKLFCVELSSVGVKQEKSSPSLEPSFASIPSQDYAPPLAQPLSYEQEDFSPTTVAFSNDAPLFQTDYAQSPQYEQTSMPAFTEPLPVAEELASVASDFKLKFDNNIFDPTPSPTTESLTHLEYSSIDDIKPDDLDFQSSLESYPEDDHEDLKNDSNLFVSNTQTSDDETFDFAMIAEELGLEISLIAQIVGEYADEIDHKMPLITESIQNSLLDLAQEDIIKLKSIALNLRIMTLFHQFEHLEKSLRYDTQEEIQYALNNVHHAIARFKMNLQ